MAFHWFGSPGNNTVTGRLNDSNLFANFGRGTDSLTGGNRSDTFFLAVDQHRHHIDGGKGIDTVDYSAADRGLTIDLQEGLTIAKFHGDLIVNPGPGGGYIDPIVDKIVTDLRNV